MARHHTLVGVAILLTAVSGGELAFAQAAKGVERPELKLAVIVSRHGVRSPTWSLERLNGFSASPWPDFGVAPGELTVHGRALMVLMGRFYRDYFTSQGLIGSGCEAASRVRFHADTDHRTLATAQALAEGLLPECKVDIESAGEGKHDPLFSRDESASGSQDAALELAAVAGRLGPRPDAIIDAHRAALERLVGVLNGGGKAAHSLMDDPVSLTVKSGVSMSGPLSLASSITEDLLLEYTDGMSGERFAWGRLDEAGLVELMALHTAYADLMRRTPAPARARGANLLRYVLRALDPARTAQAGVAAGPSGPALLVVVGHDTNLSNISGMLGLSWLIPTYQPDDTPPGGALVFSLWRSKGQYQIRIQYLAQTLDQMRTGAELSATNPPPMDNVFVPGCSSAEEGYPCSWEAFRSAAAQALGSPLN